MTTILVSSSGQHFPRMRIPGWFQLVNNSQMKTTALPGSADDGSNNQIAVRGRSGHEIRDFFWRASIGGREVVRPATAGRGENARSPAPLGEVPEAERATWGAW